MKLTKNLIRIWISLVSAAGFLGGWVMLAHAGKPAPAASTAVDSQAATVSQVEPLPTLAPLPKIDAGSSTQIQSLPATSSLPSFRPRFRTAGS